MNGKRVGFLASVALLCGASAVMADSLDTVLTTANATDNFIYNQDNNNYGASGLYFYSNRGVANEIARPLVQFTMPVLPVGAVVDSAELKLCLMTDTMADVNASGSNILTSISVYQMLVPWSASTSTWNQASTGTPWSAAGMVAGVDYASSPAATTVVSSLNYGVGVYYTWNITSLYNSWVANPSSNYGVTVLGPLGVADFTYAAGDTTDGVLRWGNTEYQSTSVQPHLALTYHVIPEPASAMLLVAGGSLLALRRRA